MKLFRISVLSMFCCVALLSAAPINGSHSNWDVSFLAIGRPSAIKVHGEGKGTNVVNSQLNWDNGSVTGKASFQLNSLSTGINLRDHHMKEKYLETQKFPVATVEVTKLNLPQSFEKSQASAEQIPFQGNLTLHGVTKPVTGTVDAKKANRDLDLTFHFDTSLSNFHITKPEFMGISIKDKVAVDVSAASLTIQ